MRNARNRRSSNPRRTRNRRRAAGPIGGGLIPHPPPIRTYQPRFEGRLRFYSSVNTTTQITFQNLLDLVVVGTVAGGAVVADVFDMVKIHFVEVWSCHSGGTNAVATIPNSVQVLFNGVTAGAQGDQISHQDTSIGIEPAHVKARPSPTCLASTFQVSSTDAAFELIILGGADTTTSVIDVGLTMIMNATGVATAAQNASAGATSGAFYWRGLDGKAPGATSYPTAMTAAAI